jgi:hypothetical protein
MLPTSAPAAEAWLVPEDKAACLLANIEKYIAIGKKPTVIYLDSCPENDPVAALAKSQKNSALPTPSHAGSRVASVVVYNPEELRCLATLKLEHDGPNVVSFPKKPYC